MQDLKNTRRRFLRQSALAATGLILTPTIIGCGNKSTASSTSSAPYGHIGSSSKFT